MQNLTHHTYSLIAAYVVGHESKVTVRRNKRQDLLRLKQNNQHINFKTLKTFKYNSLHSLSSMALGYCRRLRNRRPAFESQHSPSDETLNRGTLALLLRRQYEFPFGIKIEQFSFFSIFKFFYSQVGFLI